MKEGKKRLLLIGAGGLLFLLAVFFLARFLPVNRILKITSPPGKNFIHPQQVASQAPNSLFLDFEIDPKTGNSRGLYKGIAHSGQYAAKVFGKNTYSVAIERTAGEIGVKNLDAVAMSAWVYLFPTSNDPVSSFVFSANNSMGVNICWKGITVTGPEVPRGQWFKISGFFDLSDIRFASDTRIQIYFWNNSNTDILVDDFYVVFGKKPERKGDSALVDMTRGLPFTPRFNFPPFPFIFLEKESTGNGNTIRFVNDPKNPSRDLAPDDRILAGSFFSPPGNTEDVLVISPAGKMEGYTFCREEKTFHKTVIRQEKLQTSFPVKGKVLTGNFLPGKKSQLLFIGDNEAWLAGFETISPCDHSPQESTVKILWSSTGHPFALENERVGSVTAADLDGDQIEEIIVAGDRGTFAVYHFTGETEPQLMQLAVTGPPPGLSWTPGGNRFKITGGKFLPGNSPDVLLAVFHDPQQHASGYTLLRYDPAGRKLVPCFPASQHFLGKTIGLDTLKPGDEFFTCRTGSSGLTRIFRYNRDWRYDLKEIRFNDSTFRILANIDFQGYDYDWNPKYYEQLKIIPGKFMEPGRSSFLVVAGNCRDEQPGDHKPEKYENLSWLPDAIQVYSYPEKRDK